MTHHYLDSGILSGKLTVNEKMEDPPRNNSAEEPKTKRSQAREQVALAWQQRRQQKQRQQEQTKPSKQPSVSSKVSIQDDQPGLQSVTPGVDKRRRPSSQNNTHRDNPCFFPILNNCWGRTPSTVRDEKDKKMKSTLSTRHENNQKVLEPDSTSHSHSTKSDNGQRERSARKQSANLSARHHNIFPSLLAIHQAHELSRHVEMLLGSDHSHPHDEPSEEQEEAKREHTTTDKSLREEEESLLLSILPAEYDFEKAVFAMAQARSRAFWLLDLSTVVHRIVEWTRCFRGPHDAQNNSPGVNFHFRVAANADPLLLQVLSRFEQVRLVVGSGWEFQRCIQSLQKSAPRKTVQQCIVDDSSLSGKPDGYLRQAFMGPTSTQRLDSIAVNGPGEVDRIFASLHRIQARRRNRYKPRSEESLLALNRVCLRLPSEDPETWTRLWMDTRERLRHHSPHSTLACLSVDISCILKMDDACCEALQQLCAVASQCDGKLRLELTGQLDLSDEKSLLTLIDLRDEQWMHQLGIELTIDVTASLLSSAGALCTRVIGVKETPIRQHYYIDDGCYGSLYQSDTAKNLSLVPLISNSQPADVSLQKCLSTVWGPTCDGLDKVADNVDLPKLLRDDWLVFPNQCSLGEGLSTAFNGFCPPDTAYCVLGYFRKE